MKETWERILSESGKLLYEGFTLEGKPFGAGTVYFENGNKYQEGVFGVKGLLTGREYYPNGNVRFEGTYKLNRGYGPNYPSCGCFYDYDGKPLYEGKLTYKVSGLGYPLQANEIDIGKVIQEGHPEVKWFMWNDDPSADADNN